MLLDQIICNYLGIVIKNMLWYYYLLIHFLSARNINGSHTFHVDCTLDTNEVVQP